MMHDGGAMKTRIWMFLALVACLLPAPALAHPGHGQTDPGGWRHYLTEPQHVLSLAGAIAVLAVAWFAYRRVRDARSKRRPRASD
jgi:putative copper export protein